MNDSRAKTEQLEIIKKQMDSLDFLIGEEQAYLGSLPGSKVNTVEYIEVEDAIADLEFEKNALNDFLIYLKSTTKRR
ncbi:hypothetical protein ACN2T2_003014 [Listeria monocytogenes]|nr:hypothetical protein [Listeria monocytogenes]EAE8031230.1 hypothetical protein [Listeria monocytogenes]EAE8492052.1 hypothetical protein [Listeria monocytogenes]EAE9317850.1 hypothetical protein [Listeria monocytogenes]EAF2184351.1 hypothetical protein [Listeria monocytogenes]